MIGKKLLYPAIRVQNPWTRHLIATSRYSFTTISSIPPKGPSTSTTTTSTTTPTTNGTTNATTTYTTNTTTNASTTILKPIPLTLSYPKAILSYSPNDLENPNLTVAVSPDKKIQFMISPYKTIGMLEDQIKEEGLVTSKIAIWDGNIKWARSI